MSTGFELMASHVRSGKDVSVLIVDDDAAHAESSAECLRMVGYTVDTAVSGKEALKALEGTQYDLLLTDLVMSDMDGMELMRRGLRVNPFMAVIVFTGHGSIENAVEAMNEGAADYILKPLSVEGLRIKVGRALEARELKLANIDLRRRLDQKFGFEGIIANSAALQRVLKKIELVADTDVAVLLVGESGTGKELFARALHENSRRRNNRFIPVNCGAISPHLVESELFGHEKGAFTGAAYQRKGRFEYANGGTLFLDEIGDMPLETQVKLLRVLEDGEVYRVGSNQAQKVDVRIVSATNRNLEEEIRNGRFREDLFWRLKGILIEIPPLRERTSDIPALVHHYLKEFSHAYGKQIATIEREALSILCAYPWPGNVRELENVIERSVVLDRDGIVGSDDLPRELTQCGTQFADSVTIPLGTPLEEVERILMEETLKRTRGDKGLASKLLGISTRTLYRKMDRKEE